MPTKNELEAEVETLKQQLAEVTGQTSNIAETVAERVNGYVGHAVEEGRERAHQALEAGRQTAQTVAHDTAVRAREAEDTVTSMIRERPLMAVGIAFAAGLVMCKASSAARHRS